MYYSRSEKLLLYLLFFFVVGLYVIIVFFAVSGRPLDEVSQKWRTAAEGCVQSLERVCERERNVGRKAVGLKECQLLYEDFALFGAYECRDGKLYADLWVGDIYYSVKDKEAFWKWGE
jgi:hypothetical protein